MRHFHPDSTAWVFAGLFGFAAVICFTLDFYLNYKQWKGAGGTFMSPFGASQQASARGVTNP